MVRTLVPEMLRDYPPSGFPTALHDGLVCDPHGWRIVGIYLGSYGSSLKIVFWMSRCSASRASRNVQCAIVNATCIAVIVASSRVARGEFWPGIVPYELSNEKGYWWIGGEEQ